MAIEVTIKKEIWQWALTRAGTALDDFVARFPKLPLWVEGKQAPTLKQAQKFAQAVHIPFPYLLLDAPLEEKLPVTDFRTIGNRTTGKPSLELMDTILICQQRQTWYSEHIQEEGAHPLAFVGSLTLDTPIIEGAAAIRREVGWNPREDAATKDWQGAQTRFIEKVENIGILVMVSGIVGNDTHRTLSVDEFRGFALSDPWAPLVFVNGRDTRAARLFTLAHEVAHVFLGQSGVSDSGLDRTDGGQVEKWCNRVAAELLIPAAELKNRVQSGAVLDKEQIAKLSTWFKVSRLVVIRRLHDEGLVTSRRYSELWAKELATLRAVHRPNGGGEFYRTQLARVSPTFAAELIATVLEGRESYVDAFRMLGISKTSTFDEMRERLGVH
jgi:Zn-dependent peptidase ImmA (M78 family)